MCKALCQGKAGKVQKLNKRPVILENRKLIMWVGPKYIWQPKTCVMVNFYVSPWLDHGCHICDTRHHFSVCVCMRVFLEDISIWIGRLSKAGGFPWLEWASSSSWRTCIEQKGIEKLNSFWLLSWDVSLPPWMLLVLRPSGSNWNLHLYLPALRPSEKITDPPTGSPAPDGRSWELSASIFTWPIP